MRFLSFSLLALESFAAAKICTDMMVPLSLTAREGVFNIAIPHTNVEVTDFVLNVTQQGRNFTAEALTNYQTISKNYSISARFCKPSVDTSTNPTVQVLTHGIGFDKSYWDLPAVASTPLSYIDLATDTYKYCTLSYDRLGVGLSFPGPSSSPLNEIQSFIEIAAMHGLSMLLRSGTYPSVPHAFSKIIHVGHSFGSLLTYSFANAYPALTDALVLTGFSLDAQFVGLFAAGANFVLANRNQPARFGPRGAAFPDGYLVPSDREAIKYVFLKPHYYPDEILEIAGKVKQPVALGEILTLLSIPGVNIYAGPVMVIDGDADLVFCGSNCYATAGFDQGLPSIPAAVKNSFPNVHASNFTAYIQPNMGHGINLHYNATGAYKVMLDFTNSKGLGPL